MKQMDKEIIIAIISASAVIIAALIGIIKKKGGGNSIVVKQRNKASDTIQIGVINSSTSEDKHERKAGN